jgi:very-short-patch-repair endonuclease
VGEIFLGTEALATGTVTRYGLQTKYRKLHQNVYAPIEFACIARDRAVAAWLWSGRRATLAGQSAAAVLGSRWLPEDAPAELARCYRSSATGIRIHTGKITDDEVVVINGMSCTTAARTGYDLGRRLPFETAVIRIDALLNATRETVPAVAGIADRYPGARGIRRLRTALDFVDAGAQSPQETRLRLLLVQSGLPRPGTQIPVTDQWGRVRRRIDMGYPQWMVGVEYDGEQHWTNQRQHADDIDRLEFLASLGWVIVRVSADQLRWRQAEIVARVRKALRAAGCLI